MGGHDSLNMDRPSLALNERIVWLSDNGPEYGNVRWLGKLPDIGDEWMAGVEFDNPVGSGTGLYRDRQLFETPLNHASLVPIIGLIKASDFHENPKPKPRYLNRHGPESYEYDYDQSDDENFNQLPSRSSSNRSLKSSQATQSSNRIRHIPIKVVKEGCTDRQDHINHQTKTSQARRQKSKIIDEIDSDFERLHLGNNRPDRNLTLLPPPSFVVDPNDRHPDEALSQLLGKSKGIQGHNNSCYLDATLFSMFAATTLFDSLLYRPPNESDIPEYAEIQRILRDEIVRPLRTEQFVSADQVMLFRTLLERSSTVDGLTDQEKDPEEFLTLLLGQILKAQPYLKLSSGLESFFYQLIVDKDESMLLPTVQDLCEQSFINSTVRLREIPPCLLLQMPRFGRQYKMYPRIMPSLKLDITDILESSPRVCGHRLKDCDNIAKYECKSCFSERSGRHNARLSSITYCANCFQAKHFGKSHTTGIEDHDKTKTILEKTPQEAIARYSNKMANMKDREIPRIYMDLFAVLCIETSHYVCFVKCGQEPDSPWCFFDSMADRRGEQNGYNIPEVTHFDEFSFWTSEKGISYLLNNRDDKFLPEMAKRLICDAYLCFYQYSGLRAYR